MKEYKIEETNRLVTINENESVFNRLLASKEELANHKGEYVAILNGKLVGYGKDPVELEKGIELKEGKLYIRELTVDTRLVRL